MIDGRLRPVYVRAKCSSLRWPMMALASNLVAAASGVGAVSAQTPLASDALRGATGLRVPRFVSLKSDPVNIRKGPGTEYPIAWVYRRAGLPVEIIQEFQGWRQVRDAEGATGWVLYSLLSGRRTALVVPWDLKTGDAKVGATKSAALVPLQSARREGGSAIAMVEAGTLANVRSCDGTWCEIVVDRFRGFISQPKLWGVYANETLP